MDLRRIPSSCFYLSNRLSLVGSLGWNACLAVRAQMPDRDEVGDEQARWLAYLAFPEDLISFSHASPGVSLFFTFIEALPQCEQYELLCVDLPGTLKPLRELD